MENIYSDLNKRENGNSGCKENELSKDNFGSSTKLATVDSSLDIQFVGTHIYWQFEDL